MTRSLCFVATLLALLLAACGQSGPLYLPGNPSEVEEPAAAPAATAPAVATEEEDEDEDNDENR